MARKIEVVDYRPEWAVMFKEEAKKIKKILGKNCIGIYHIGSTAVKGLPAKPIIDIMPVVKDLSLVDAHNKNSKLWATNAEVNSAFPEEDSMPKAAITGRITSIHLSRAIRRISNGTSPCGIT